MSLYDCIQRAIDAGDMDTRRGRAAQAFFRDRLQAHAHLGEAAQEAAAEDTWIKMRRDAAEKRKTTLMQVKRNLDNLDKVTRFRDTDGEARASNVIRQFLEWGQSAEFSGVTAIADSLAGQYRRGIADFIEQHKRGIIGNVRNKALLPNIVRELFGEGTGDAGSKVLADAISATLERARLDFNAAGGMIGKLEDFGLPQSWDDNLVRRAGFDAWANAVNARLDWERMTDFETHQSFAGSTPERRKAFLRQVYDNITSYGWNGKEPSGVAAGRALGNRRADHRVLHFRNADDWLAMNGQFGRQDVFGTVVTHLETMARDTALMRVLGPNPRAGLEFIGQTAEKLAVDRPWTQGQMDKRLYSSPVQEVRARKAQARVMYDLYTGSANTPESDMVASAFSGVRHFLVASQLGGAMLSAVSDVGFISMASRHVGMNWQRVVGRQLKAIASSGQRGLMVRAGIIADSAANTGVAQARLLGDAYGPAVAERLSEFTMRASGLTAWTDISRGAFRLEFYGYLADNVGRSWDELDAPLRDLVFKTRGITEADWDTIRATDLFRDEADPDAAFLVPSMIRDRADLDPEQAMDLSLRLEAAIREEQEFAVPSASLRGRSIFQLGAPGTFAGEFLRSGLMYKSFALSLMFNQIGRLAFHKLNGSRAANIALFAAMTTAMGALSIQLKDMAKGRDPRPMDNPEFLQAAILQGGGLGIIGDFAYSTQNRFGGGLATTLAGPGVGFANDTGRLVGDIVGVLTGAENAEQKLSRTAVRYLNQYSGPTNLWYANAAIDRMVWDNLQELTDPEAAKSFRQAERRQVREYGNQSWWQRGQPLPSRFPDIRSLLEADQ